MRVRSELPAGVESGDRAVLRLVGLDLWRRSARFKPAS